jgi:hypothetical protein
VPSMTPMATHHRSPRPRRTTITTTPSPSHPHCQERRRPSPQPAFGAQIGPNAHRRPPAHPAPAAPCRRDLQL